MHRSTEVSVRPAWASPPGTPHDVHATLRCSDRSSSTALVTVSALPPWPFTKITPSAQRQAERAYSTSSRCSASWPMEMVPGKSSCSPLAP